MVTGETRISLAAGLQGRQQAPSVGQDPVGAAEQVDCVVVLAGERHPGAVCLQLDGREERLLGVFLPLGDVMQGHRRSRVPGIALQDVDGQAELGEPGQPGMPEPVGMAEPDRPGLAVGELGQAAECPLTNDLAY